MPEGSLAGPGSGRAGGKRADEKRYLREVEKHFLRRRGSPLLLSPRDWALALAWYEQGIPLSVVITGIDDVFNRATESASGRKPRTLSYCRGAVEHAWEERTRLLVDTRSRDEEDGRQAVSVPAATLERLATAIRQTLSSLEALSAGLPPADVAAIGKIAGNLNRIAQELKQPAGTAIARIEQELVRYDDLIGRRIRSTASAKTMMEAAGQVEKRLEAHRPHMTESAYRGTYDRALDNRLRELLSLPRLSLILLLD